MLTEIPWWLSGLRIWCGHCYALVTAVAWVPSWFYMLQAWPKKKKKEKKKVHTNPLAWLPYGVGWNKMRQNKLVNWEESDNFKNKILFSPLLRKSNLWTRSNPVSILILMNSSGPSGVFSQCRFWVGALGLLFWLVWVGTRVQNEQTQFVTLPEVALSLFEKLSRTERTFPG